MVEWHGSAYTWIFFQYLYCFLSAVRSSQMQRANCMHWSTPFNRGDLSIQGLWYLWGVLEPISQILSHNLSFGGVKSYTWIWLCRESVLLIPLLFKGQLYTVTPEKQEKKIKFTQVSTLKIFGWKGLRYTAYVYNARLFNFRTYLTYFVRKSSGVENK